VALSLPVPTAKYDVSAIHFRPWTAAANRLFGPVTERISKGARKTRVGPLRPAIVLYGETDPLGDTIAELCRSDGAKKPDVLLIMGTSLAVHGIKGLVKQFARAVHAPSKGSGRAARDAQSAPEKVRVERRAVVVYVNLDPPPSDMAGFIDYWVEGFTDEWVKKVEIDWRTARPGDWEVRSTTTSEDLSSIPALLPSITIACHPWNAGCQYYQPLIPRELMPFAVRLPPPTSSHPNTSSTLPQSLASSCSFTPLIPPHLMPTGALQACGTQKLPVMNLSSPTVAFDPFAVQLPPPTSSRPNTSLTLPQSLASSRSFTPHIPPHLMPTGALQARGTQKLPVMNPSSPTVAFDCRSPSTHTGVNARSRGVDSIEPSAES
jgi:hypothetical protein